ncbi:unnamed protein product [Medioppia subpectinata]|uniref:UBX domain-containing protein n=1 Tax=Medioppia subpectinata TaxID=1979941 RepID=A0A7R9KDD1_9ACAR|nr:unnamed protein product [Medioppia subpectinata]CAG2101022.1 unnamed protein product [Medioppia subpectinata]
MANAIKDFFKKKKLDAKFMGVGSGHRLADSTSSSTSGTTSSASNSNINQTNAKNPKNMTTQKAAEAAIERIQRQQSTNKSNTLENILQEERQKISEEYRMKEKAECLVKEEEKLDKKYKDFDANQRFSCPTIELNESLIMEELLEQILDFIQTNFADDLTLMSVLTLINCNSSPNEESEHRVEECIKTLDKVVSNLENSSPDERQKFSKIRKSKIEKKVLELKGGLEFLVSIGFEVDSTDEWLVFSDETPDIRDQMSYYRDVLNSAQKFPLILDRQTVRLESNQKTQNQDLSQDFFRLSTDEVVREMQTLTDKRETEETLRTKAMRETKKRNINSKFSRLRFRFANGVQIEATFGSNETLVDVKNWLLERMESDKEFNLKCVHEVFTQQHSNQTLKALNLVPTAALLIVSKDD